MDRVILMLNLARVREDREKELPAHAPSKDAMVQRERKRFFGYEHLLFAQLLIGVTDHTTRTGEVSLTSAEPLIGLSPQRTSRVLRDLKFLDWIDARRGAWGVAFRWRPGVVVEVDPRKLAKMVQPPGPRIHVM